MSKAIWVTFLPWFSSGNGFGAIRRLVTICRSPSRGSCAGGVGYWSQPHLCVPQYPLCQSAGKTACLSASESEWSKLLGIYYLNFLRWFGSFWHRWFWKRLHPQLGSRPVREADSAKGGLQRVAWGQGHLQLPGGPGTGIQTPPHHTSPH